MPAKPIAAGRNQERRMGDQEIREALQQHWTASNSGDFATEHDIYLDDAVLDYPQSRERILGRQNIQTTRTLQPNKKRFVVHRIMGSGDLWIARRSSGGPALSS
jgi:ketosteroid isomerase-like protein